MQTSIAYLLVPFPDPVYALLPAVCDTENDGLSPRLTYLQMYLWQFSGLIYYSVIYVHFRVPEEWKLPIPESHS